MGMFDEVWWQAELPPGHSPENRLFQTKSLHRCLDQYVVTTAGRLCLVSNGWKDGEPFEGAYDPKTAEDTEFHGDIRLVALDGAYREYVARFTHGTLEWIHPIADIPARVNQNLTSD